MNVGEMAIARPNLDTLVNAENGDADVGEGESEAVAAKGGLVNADNVPTMFGKSQLVKDCKLSEQLASVFGVPRTVQNL